MIATDLGFNVLLYQIFSRLPSLVSEIILKKIFTTKERKSTSMVTTTLAKTLGIQMQQLIKVRPPLPPPSPVKFFFNTTNTAWRRGGQHKQALITTFPSFFKRQNMHDFIQQSASLCPISLSVPCFDQDYSHANKISSYEKISKEFSEIYLSRYVL